MQMQFLLYRKGQKRTRKTEKLFFKNRLGFLDILLHTTVKEGATMEEKQTLNLSGVWQLCWQDTCKDHWQALDSGVKATKDSFWKESIPCQVPGDVHIALTEAGIIEDPLVDVNSEKCRWVEEKEFWYKKEFEVAPEFLGDRVELVFEGLDLTSDIWLNGEYIGNHNNAFIAKSIDVTNLVNEGKNTLVVRIDDGVAGVKDKPLDLMEYSWNAEQPYRAWMRKPQFVYGWDWTIWMPTCGIWKRVSLHSYREVAIRDVNVKSTLYDDKGQLVENGLKSLAKKVRFHVDVETQLFGSQDYLVNVAVYSDERYAGKRKMLIMGATRCREGITSLEFEMMHPKLWWPNGAGDQYLYEICVSIEDKAGNILQEVSQKYGIRTVSIREAVLDAKSKSFTYVINGQPIFAKGANHVPADCFPGRITAKKNRKLLQMAAKANMNMIRVWGGGIYESDDFMQACDELGIMVWHDFMFACAYYPDHVPEFYEEIGREATAAIKRLRKYSSLVGWSGNNEIQEMYLSAKNSGKNFPWYGGRLYEELLPSLVEKLCPDRIYRQSSPFGGEEPTSYDMGDQHTWHFTHRPSWEHYLDLWRFTDFDFKFLSEFGIIGAMNLESAKKCISADKLYRNSPEWIHHTNTSVEHKLLDIFVEKYFGNPADMELQEFILKSQALQGEMMRHVYDELRSRKFRCSGVLLWTLSDSYGIHNWSVIDYFLGKRPLYYYMKRSLAPINVSFMGYQVQTFDGMAGYRDYYQGKTKPIEILVTSDELRDREVTVEYQIMTFDGKVLKGEKTDCTLLTNQMTKVMEVSLEDIKESFSPTECLLYAKVSLEGKVISTNRYFFAPYKDLELPKTKVRCTVEKVSKDASHLGETRYHLSFKADDFVWMLHLATPDGVEYEDNDFDLMPGKVKEIEVVVEDGLEIVKEFEPVMHCLNPALTIEVERT